MEPHGPLSGVRVVEFAVAVQGPLAGGFLADMGADVIKVEPPGGDANRWHTGVNWPHPKETPGAQFLSVSHGKRSISVDIHSDAGREVMHRLIDRADIFLSNFREPSLERMGMGYEALSARNPRLVYAIANGFGHRGPDRDKRMTDQFAQSRSGIASVTGEPDSATVIPGSIIGDTGGAMGLALGIMTALAARELHGIGQKVQTSSYGIMVWMQAWEINHSSVTGTMLRRDGPHHPNVPGIVGLYDTADGGAFCVGINSDESWREFCDFGGIPEVGADPQWDSYDKRSPRRTSGTRRRPRNCVRMSRGRCAIARRRNGSSSSTRTKRTLCTKTCSTTTTSYTTHKRWKTATSSRRTCLAPASDAWSATRCSSARRRPSPSPGTQRWASTRPRSWASWASRPTRSPRSRRRRVPASRCRGVVVSAPGRLPLVPNGSLY